MARSFGEPAWTRRPPSPGQRRRQCPRGLRLPTPTPSGSDPGRREETERDQRTARAPLPTELETVSRRSLLRTATNCTTAPHARIAAPTSSTRRLLHHQETANGMAIAAPAGELRAAMTRSGIRRPPEITFPAEDDHRARARPTRRCRAGRRMSPDRRDRAPSRTPSAPSCRDRPSETPARRA